MAPQLGMGTFRISHIDHAPHPDDSYATSDGAAVEIWALRIGVYQQPGASVDLFVTRVDQRFRPDMCGYLTSLGEMTSNFEVIRHQKAVVQCP